jgi:hypothetical protein
VRPFARKIMVLFGIKESNNLQENEHVPVDFLMMFVERRFVTQSVKDIPVPFDIKKDFKKSIHPVK